MATAIVNSLNHEKRAIRCRALLDTASTANFITERLAKKLALRQQSYRIPIEGLGQMQTSSSHLVTITIQSRYNNFEKTLSFLTVPEIARLHPSNAVDRREITIPSNIQLADPTFHVPSEIDMLIGAGPSFSMFCVGQMDLSSTRGADLFLQKTRLGWVIAGAVSIPIKQGRKLDEKGTLSCKLTTAQALNQLSKIWNIEEGPKIKHLTREERECEEHFLRHAKRHEDGRYVVALPFNEKKQLLGESRRRAEIRLLSLEKKFKREPKLKEQYTSVIQEYIDLGHMVKVQGEIHDKDGFYLPHHAVLKETSLTTKLRVVFDGSAKSTTGISLNDALMTGPTIQDELITHLLRFRFHAFVLTGDIEKMYRQTWIRSEDKKYQRILWRTESGNVDTYELKTVTFGLSSAPYLAIRSLQKLAEDEGQRFPIAAEIIRRDIYVDDLLTGAKSFEEALEARNQITQLLNRGSLNLRQWASNDPRLLKDLPESNLNAKLQLDGDSSLKTLGIHWQSQKDSINYTIRQIPTKATMRIILSEIAKIFDPLGLLGPVTIAGRLILQECWRHHVNWDETLPVSIHTAWTTFAQQFNKMEEISYERGVIPTNTKIIELHGFCDASERAYGASIYIRCISTTGDIQSRLLCSKIKVAPLKVVTLARLELCAAVMLTRLYDSVREHINFAIAKTFFWSDSTITLHWINTAPHLLKTFVANRVSEIQTKTRSSEWRHIRSDDNPADALSRGQAPEQFLKNALWRHGPKWLTQKPESWPNLKIIIPSEDEEKRRLVCLTSCLASAPRDDSILKKYSTINRLRRIVSYCLRLKRDNVNKGPLALEEVDRANICIIKLTQEQAFPAEIHDLQHGEVVRETSSLKCLCPFLDQNGLMRVKGRLLHAEIPISTQQPIILPKSHHITQLIIKDEHERHFHAGAQATLYAVRRKYWPLNGRNEVRRIIRQCVRCNRVNPQTAAYTMGNLPKERVTETPRPFYNIGVDYCGPFYLKEKKHRNRNRVKAYVAVFVCLAVKAVHLEVVSDLTTQGFIAALRRFIARRGKCHSIHSDNGTNFIGANNEMKETYAQINLRQHQEKVQRYLTREGIIWKFIPPRSPHFGGLWEAAVKSYKHHMRRVIGDTLLTLEDFNTFVIEIEAVLNSRPLTTLSTDATDPIALTPGHFLIGNSLTSIPERDYSNTPLNRLSSWEQVQRIKQAFWKRWHKEYINGLNVRTKWTKGDHKIKEGTIVVIKDDDARSLHWKLGRVIKTHPGPDGIIRTVTLKTESGIIDRNVRKLAPLLHEEKED